MRRPQADPGTPARSPHGSFPHGSFPPGPPGPGRRPDEPPGRPPRPGHPRVPGQPEVPGVPGWPGRPQPPAAPPAYPATSPARGWVADQGAWPGALYQRLMERRIVLASGRLDTEAATLLSAQLLTLDAEGDQPVRLELQGLEAELPSALTVMGVLDVVRAPVTGYVAGLAGAALGVLAACPRRLAYPSAVLALAEPKLSLDGTATEVSIQEEQVRAMLDSLYLRLAEVTGQEVDTVREDARHGRFFTVPDAISYGLIEGEARPESRPRPGFH